MAPSIYSCNPFKMSSASYATPSVCETVSFSIIKVNIPTEYFHICFLKTAYKYISLQQYITLQIYTLHFVYSFIPDMFCMASFVYGCYCITPSVYGYCMTPCVYRCYLFYMTSSMYSFYLYMVVTVRRCNPFCMTSSVHGCNPFCMTSF